MGASSFCVAGTPSVIEKNICTDSSSHLRCQPPRRGGLLAKRRSFAYCQSLPLGERLSPAGERCRASDRVGSSGTAQAVTEGVSIPHHPICENFNFLLDLSGLLCYTHAVRHIPPMGKGDIVWTTRKSPAAVAARPLSPKLPRLRPLTHPLCPPKASPPPAAATRTAPFSLA